ncbi:sulfite exporter TauE/SafE family protein [Chitinophaga japonensis]|uniref:Probable membrane transporter protein n=1 Tax=Chitinophaga japonensis TaxID=104662 RepID=A0A562T6K6_CHIJA|nr:TSUP family transporter [Chitinophaga japonensis]TWI89181.1 hypothetical protein LX66_3275 [Chitinophaga japonensis]
MIATELLLLCCFSLCAGFIDAIVGGGGLIQTPAILFTFPQYPVATLLGTTKIPSFSGTSMAAWQYSQKVRFHRGLLGVTAVTAFFAAMLGASLVSYLPNRFLKPVMLVLLIGVAIYTYLKKDFGQQAQAMVLPAGNTWLWGIVIGGVIGFYDGFFGPGTGSFLILAFISLMGFDFLHASAHAKVVNLATNMAAIIYFASHGHILWTVTLLMAASNLAGSFFGARLAILKGNTLVRRFFLLVVCATILRFAWELLK